MALQLLSRAQMRDSIRRMLQIVPPVDDGTGAPGQAPARDPYPTNPQLNDALDQAVADINLETGFHTNTIQIALGASSLPLSTNRGPFITSLTSNSTLAVAGAVRTVKYVRWIPTTGTANRVMPADYQAWDRDALQYDWRSVPPANVPQWYWTQGYNFNVLPWPNVTGVFELIVGSGLNGFTQDSDTIDELPVEFQTVVLYQALVRISKLSTMSVESQERAASFGQDAQRGMLQLKSWQIDQNDEFQPSLAVQTYRHGYGLQRMRR